MVVKKSVVADMVEGFPHDASDAELVRALTVYQAKELRTACTRLHLNPQADPQTNNKEGYIEMLRTFRHQRREGLTSAMTGPQKTTALPAPERASQHSRFRLANCVFSDEMIERMAEMDGVPGRNAIDTGSVNGRSLYWQDVATLFASKNKGLDGFIATRDAYQDIRPGDAQPLSSEKLEKMWKEERGLFSTAKQNSVTSGTNDRDFSLYCGGRLDVLYVHDWLDARPGYEVLIIGQLPKDARVNTMRAKRAAEISEQHRSNNKRRRAASAAVEDKILNMLEQEQESVAMESSVRNAADLADAVHKGMQVIKDLKEAGADIAYIESVQQSLNPLLSKWLAAMANASETSSG